MMTSLTRKYPSDFSFLAVLIAFALPFVSDRACASDEPAEKDLMLVVEEAYRSPPRLQEKEVLRLYARLHQGERLFPCAMILEPGRDNYEKMSLPEIRAEWKNPDRRCALAERALRLFDRLIVANARILKPALTRDLRAKESRKVQVALEIIATAKMKDFSEAVLRILKESREPSITLSAAVALRDLGVGGAIPALVSKDDPALSQYFELLRDLSKNRVADPGLRNLLRSPNETTRWRSIYILSESRDSSLVPHALPLLRDASPEVRRHAVSFFFLLDPKDFRPLRADLVKMLDDPSREVRAATAIFFAEKKDLACARTLVSLLKDEVLDENAHSGIVSAVHNLTGSYFGYHVGSDGWKPTTPANQKAILKYEEWVRTAISE